ncbi:hypothetical protein [Methylobacterium platani]|uniref:hypothetical protein n=1 Tax=Methylobacterium platani TaxID=427683 RepID=UPI000AE3B51E|nr:hypothetical protein [Methylobacterium platani]
MAKLPTPEESGRLVLNIYAHFNSRPGHVLRANNFVAVASRQRIHMEDIQQGLDYAASQKWIEETDNGCLRLTELGFREMP